MNFYIRKILQGLGFSLSGILLSILWYKFDLSRSKIDSSENKKIVAVLGETKNEVQKKQVSRVIWQRVDEEEPLHAGEAVRTASDSEAKIVFNSGAQIQMDPDSVVVIEESGNKLSLDFIKGNLFFKGGGKESQLALKSGNTSIDLQNSEAALNKSQDGKALDVQVLSGTAQLSQNGKSVTLDRDKAGVIDDRGLSVAEKFIKIKSPQAFSKIYIQIAKKEPVLFEWEKLPPNFDIYLEIGSKRENLSRMYPKVSANLGMMAMQLKLGNYFWRLVAIDNKDPSKTYFTSVNKISILAEVPPKLIQPVDESIATLSAQTQTLLLRWANPSKLEKLHIEISKDPKFSKNIYSEIVADTGIHEAPLTEEGIYYWRIAGFRSGTSKEVVSQAHKFVLKTKLELVPPKLKEPSSNFRAQVESIRAGLVFLKWDPVLGFNEFHVRIFQGEKIAHEQKVNDVKQVRFNIEKPGQYKWAVYTIDAQGKASNISEQRIIIVDELPQLLWLDSKQQDQYFYLTEKPQLRVLLKPIDKIKNYKITYAKDGDAKSEKTLTVANPDKIFDVPTDGLYKVFVEALNDKSQVVAKSFTKDIVVQALPLLPPPEFSETTANVIQASKRGTANISFSTVGGAKSYFINFKSAAGKILKQEKVTSTSPTLSKLLPGSYKISVSSVDVHGRPGPSGEEKTLNVPAVSDSKAPKLKRLRVK
ncbi:MAG: FecR domain-containing protein [Oligoflexia bacterium]|nr:FecR domain-containing protein [Oligoflexia bacterium]